MADAATYDIGRERFDRALAVLEAEQKATGLSKAQRYFLRLYTTFIWGFCLLFITMIVYRLALIPSRSLKGIHFTLNGLIALGASLFLLCAVLLLFLNIPAIVKFVQQRRRFRRLGFPDISESLWKEYRRTHRGSALVGKISLGLSIFFLSISVLSVFSFLLLFRAGIKMAFLGFGFYFVLSILLGVVYVLQIGKDWLEITTLQWKDATHLKELMVNSRKNAEKAGLERIPVAVEAIKQFAHIENFQIARSREEAIAESITAPVKEFSILLSQQALKVKAGLNPEDRLKVEHTLDALMVQPKTACTEQDTHTGSLRQPVSSTGLELIYQIDDAARQLKVLSLEYSTRSTAGRASA